VALHNSQGQESRFATRSETFLQKIRSTLGESKTWKSLERALKNKELTRIEGGVTRFIETSRHGIIDLFSSPCKVTMTMSS